MSKETKLTELQKNSLEIQDLENKLDDKIMKACDKLVDFFNTTQLRKDLNTIYQNREVCRMENAVFNPFKLKQAIQKKLMDAIKIKDSPQYTPAAPEVQEASAPPEVRAATIKILELMDVEE